MNILIVQGGGRPRGNTQQLVEAFAAGAREAGHRTETVFLRSTVVNGCLGCNACRWGRPCVQRDGFNDLVPRIRRADLLALASPLLFWTISSQLKAFLERFYSLAEPDDHPPLGRYERYPEKDAVLLMTAADDLFWTWEQAVSYYRFTVIRYMGFRDRGMLLAGGCGESSGKPRIRETDHLQRAFAFGKSLQETPREQTGPVPGV